MIRDLLFEQTLSSTEFTLAPKKQQRHRNSMALWREGVATEQMSLRGVFPNDEAISDKVKGKIASWRQGATRNDT
jgi:hypothetical protein